MMSSSSVKEGLAGVGWRVQMQIAQKANVLLYATKNIVAASKGGTVCEV
jgi:hypothetical protein